MFNLEPLKSILSVFVLLTLGCSSSIKEKDHLYFSHFPSEVEIKLEEITTAPVLSFVVELLLVDSYLVAYSLMSDSLFSFFELPNFKYLGSQVAKGEGPNEESFIVPTLLYYDTNTFFYKTVDNVKIVSYEKDKSTINLKNKIDLPIEFLDVMHFVLLNEKLIGWSLYDVTNEFEFLSFNTQTQKVSSFGPAFPSDKVKIQLTDKTSLYSKTILNRPDNMFFAALYDRYPYLRIYNTSGELLKEVRYINNQINPAKKINSNNPMSYMDELTLNYMKLKVTNKFIYGLYSGKTHAELRTKENKVDDYCSEVHIWDWNGNPVAKIKLDRPVFSFTVDTDNSFIVFSSVNEHDRFFFLKLENYVLPNE